LRQLFWAFLASLFQISDSFLSELDQLKIQIWAEFCAFWSHRKNYGRDGRNIIFIIRSYTKYTGELYNYQHHQSLGLIRETSNHFIQKSTRAQLWLPLQREIWSTEKLARTSLWWHNKNVSALKVIIVAQTGYL